MASRLNLRHLDLMVRSLSLLIFASSLVTIGCNEQHEIIVPVDPTHAELQAEPFGPLNEAAAKKVQSDVLYTVYSQNINIGANPYQRFLRQQLLVSGVVNGLNQRLPLHTYIELRTHDREAFTYAELDPAFASLLTSITPGSELQLLCWGDGMIAGSPLLANCRKA